MRWDRRCALGCLALTTACCKPEARRSEASAPSAAATATASGSVPPSALVVASEVEVPGLRVRSGSIQARRSLWGFSQLVVDTRRVELELVLAPRGGSLQSLLPQGALAVVNGGYFEADFKPSTWLVHRGVQLAPKSDPSKGGVLALAPPNVYLGPLAGLGFAPRLAVQSFPLIVEPGGKPGIHRDDGRRAARTVVCLVDGALQFVLIAAPRGDGPTLFESVALLRAPPPHGFGCERALNLDGGPSSGVWFGPGVPARQRAPTAPVAYGIALVPAEAGF